MILTTFNLWIPGRPAPQGSKRLGEHGQLLEQSPYLAAWRGKWTGKEGTPGRKYRHGAIGRAVYAEYARLRLDPADLPLMRGPVSVSLLFQLDTDPDQPPDVDKLARATLDGLGQCRVFEDDARVRTLNLYKVGTQSPSALPIRLSGCYVSVTPYEPQRVTPGDGLTIIKRARLHRRYGVPLRIREER